MDIQIHIALSNHLFSEGIKRLLIDADVNATINEVHPSTSDFDADIVLFDTKKHVRALIEAHPKARLVLIDTGLKDTDLACLLLCHQISGIIPQDTDMASFCKAIKVIYSGDIWLDQKHIKTLINTGKALPEGDGVKGLSCQDMRIVEFIALGCKNREIADKLCLSEATIKAHVSRIYKTLKVKNRAQLACLAHENELH